MKIFEHYIEDSHRITSIFGLKFKSFNVRQEIKDLKKETAILRAVIQRAIDITKIPKATGNFRTVQLIKSQILEFAVTLFEKYNIQYWLEYGTLIGAIRHGGFIPWDDDVDIAMLKSDYLKLPQILEQELKGTEFYFSYGVETGSQLIRLHYKDFFIDFFPFEYIDKKYNTIENKHAFVNKWFKIKELILKKYPLENFKTGKKNHFDVINYANKLKKEVFGDGYYENQNSGQLIRPVETLFRSKNAGIIDVEDLFPLQKVNFEHLSINAPKNILNHLYQNDIYGEYGAVMSFPTISDTGFHHSQSKYNNTEKYNKIYNDIKLLVNDYKNNTTFN